MPAQEVTRAIIQQMKQAGGVWFATGNEVPRWCRDEIFKARTTAPRKSAAS